MKRIICLLLVALLVFSMAACSSKPTGNTETPSTNQTEGSTPTNSQNTATTESTADDAEGTVLQVPSKEIYFSCPDGWTYSKETYSTVLMETDECLVAVCYNWAVPYEGDMEGIVDFFAAGVMRDVAPYSKGYLGAATISTTSTEKTSMAGYDCVKFTGTAPNSEWNCHVYGYTMIVDGVPMMIIGLVSTQEQDATMISDINALTDQIAASIRTEK